MYEDRTAEAIRAEMASDIQKLTGLAPVAGGFVDTLIGRTAVEHAKVYAALNAVFSLLFVDENSGGFLDIHGLAYHNLRRREGTKARVAMSFRGTPGAIIPEGTSFLTPDGLEFFLEGGVALQKNGTGQGWALSAEAGERYNIPADALTRMYVNLAGLDEWHNAAASGGSDAESDAALYARIDEKRKRPPTSGNVYDYRQWALEIPGVGAVKVIPLSNGPGSVDVMVVGNDMEPAAEDIVDAVAANIDRQRPIGPAVTVGSPTGVAVTIAATVELVDGASLETVKSTFVGALNAYLMDLIKRKYSAIYSKASEDTAYTVVYNRVAALLMDVDGVANYTALTLNGTVANLTVASDKVPTLSEVTISASS